MADVVIFVFGFFFNDDNVSALCRCLESPEAKVKRFRLVALTKELSETPCIVFVL